MYKVIGEKWDWITVEEFFVDTLPEWMGKEDVEAYVASYARIWCGTTLVKREDKKTVIPPRNTDFMRRLKLYKNSVFVCSWDIYRDRSKQGRL